MFYVHVVTINYYISALVTSVISQSLWPFSAFLTVSLATEEWHPRGRYGTCSSYLYCSCLGGPDL